MSFETKESLKLKNNKKLQDIIHRFEYNSEFFQNSQQCRSYTPSANQLKHLQIIKGQNQYHSLKQVRDTYSHQSYLNQELLLQISKQSLLPHHTKTHDSVQPKANYKIENKSKEQSFQSKAMDIIVVQDKIKQKIFSQKSNGNSLKSSSTLSSLSQNSDLKSFTIYLIHFPNEGSETHENWTYFVEKISVRSNAESRNDRGHPIKYESILSFPKSSWIQNNVISWFKPLDKTEYLKKMELSIDHRLNLFESMLAKQLMKLSHEQAEEGKNCHPQFKRESQLPPEQYRKFQKIKSITYEQFALINKKRKINRYFLDNLVCRYMMVKKYNEHQSIEAIKKYLKWQKQMRDKYTYQSFNHYHPLNIFQYLGKDFEGRPIIYFQSEKFLPELIADQQNYLDYNSFMFQIFLQDKLEGEGYIDEFILIANYSNFGSANFKLSIAKEFSATSNQYFPQRQSKLILFGVNSFGEWIFKLLKPVLPEFIMRKINIFGSDKKQLKQFLEKHVDLTLLPKEILGQLSVSGNQKSTRLRK